MRERCLIYNRWGLCDMSLIDRKAMFVQLSVIPGMDKESDGTL